MFPSYYTGFADEAGPDLATQIRVTRELGWSAIELRNVRLPGGEAINVHDIPDDAFERVVAQLGEAGVRVNCLGSALGNFSKDIRQPFDAERASAQRAAARGRRLGAEFIRVMSYPIGDPADLHEAERFRRLREIVAIFADSGVTVVHENCGNYGGMSPRHSRRLLEEVPGLRLVFDMGNTVSDLDYSQPAPHPRQSAWEFYQGIRDHIAYVHIKDAVWDHAANKKNHVYPGDGEADVPRIVADLFARGYASGLSIEPHMHAGLSEADAAAVYVRYGRRLMDLVQKIIPAPAAAQ